MKPGATPDSDIKEVGEKLILIKPHQPDLKWTNWAAAAAAGGEQKRREREGNFQILCPHQRGSWKSGRSKGGCVNFTFFLLS